MILKKLVLSLLLTCFFASGFVNATGDEDLNINSDFQDLNYKNNTLHFYGNVSVRQGNISIKADDLFVETKDGVGQKLIAKGKPASFSQLDAENGELKATANEIVYVVDRQVLTLNGEARFEQGGSLVQSGKIEFDLKAQRVKADGDQSTGGRVITTIKTKKKSGSN